MTSPEWSPAPFAQWIKAGLERLGKNKHWLARHLVEKRGISKDAAEKNVNRWTAHDSEPKDENLRVLVALFGVPPSPAEVAAYRDHEARITDLERGQHELKQQFEEEANGHRQTIADLQAALRQTGGKR